MPTPRFQDLNTYKTTQDQKYDFVDANDPTNGGTDFTFVRLELVVAQKGRGYMLRPHCENHGSMNKVSGPRETDYGLWRCLHPGCRSACKQVSKIIHGFQGNIDSVTREPVK